MVVAEPRGWADVFVYAVAIVVFAVRLRLETVEGGADSTFRNDELARMVDGAFQVAWPRARSDPGDGITELFWVLVNAVATMVPSWVGAAAILKASPCIASMRKECAQLSKEDQASAQALLNAIK